MAIETSEVSWLYVQAGDQSFKAVGECVEASSTKTTELLKTAFTDCSSIFEVNFEQCHEKSDLELLREAFGSEPDGFDLVIKPGKWFGPNIVLRNVQATDIKNEDGYVRIDFGGYESETTFAHWWYRPIWWLWRMWQRFWSW